MTEGPSSTLFFFDLAGSHPGCENNALKYLSINDETLRTWPSRSNMQDGEFKVVFDMKQELPNIQRSTEFFVKFYDNRWYTRSTKSDYTIAASCPDKSSNLMRSFCVAGLPMIYSPSNGMFHLDLTEYGKFNISVPLWLRDPLGRAEVLDGNIEFDASQRGKVGLVPCNVKWTNSHRVVIPTENPICLYFQAASAGCIHIIFAGLPNNYRTWKFLLLSL